LHTQKICGRKYRGPSSEETELEEIERLDGCALHEEVKKNGQPYEVARHPRRKNRKKKNLVYQK